MASSSGFSKLQKKFGARLDKVVQKHANDPTDYGNIQLPAGIRNGIARIVSAKIDTYKTGANKDKDYLHIQAVVIEPEYVTIDGRELKVAGLRTKVQETLDDTKTQGNKVTTAEEHLQRSMNLLRTLVGEDSLDGYSCISDLDSALDTLNDDSNPVYVRFSTSERKDYKTGKVGDGCWENWYGSAGLEDYVPPITSDTAVEDDSGDAPAPEAGQEVDSEEPTPATPKKWAKEGEKGFKPPEGKPAPGKPSGAAVEASSGHTTDEEGEGEEEASSEEDGQDDEGGGEQEVAPEAIPEVKHMYHYHPIDPKTKKPSKNPVEVRVLAVDAVTRTVKIKNVDDNKTVYIDVPWGELKED